MGGIRRGTGGALTQTAGRQPPKVPRGHQARPRRSRMAQGPAPTHLHARQQRLQQLLVVRAGGQLGHGCSDQQRQQAVDAAALVGQGGQLVHQAADLQDSTGRRNKGAPGLAGVALNK